MEVVEWTDEDERQMDRLEDSSAAASASVGIHDGRLTVRVRFRSDSKSTWPRRLWTGYVSWLACLSGSLSDDLISYFIITTYEVPRTQYYCNPTGSRALWVIRETRVRKSVDESHFKSTLILKTRVDVIIFFVCLLNFFC